MDDVVFKDILRTTPVASLADTVTVTDIVNSTKFLAELLNTGKVRSLALCGSSFRSASGRECSTFLACSVTLMANAFPSCIDVRAHFPRLLADMVDHIDRPGRGHGHILPVDRLDEICRRFYGLVLDSRRTGSPRSW